MYKLLRTFAMITNTFKGFFFYILVNSPYLNADSNKEEEIKSPWPNDDYNNNDLEAEMRLYR